MKRKNYRQAFFIFLVSALLALTILPAKAQVTTPTNTVTFSMLAQKEMILNGPLDNQSFSFNLPADWKLLDGGQLHINYNTFFNDVGSIDGKTVPVAGFVEISLNDKPISTLVLDSRGENSIDIPIPTSLWLTTDPHNPTHSLQFFLKTAEPCHASNLSSVTTSSGLSVIVRPTSYLLLPHDTTPVVTDLRRLPFPIYQKSIFPDKAVLVMSDSPTAADLQAVMITSASFGRLTGGKLALDMTTYSKIDPARYTDSHMIFVGRPSAFPVLTQAKWPAQISGDGFIGTTKIGVDDGILLATVSPSNPALVWMLVSGQNDIGLIKAAQSLGSGEIRIADPANLSVIVSAEPLKVSPSTIVDHAFADFGYGNETRYGPGVRFIAYHFQIPAGEVASPEAYLDLVFAHSSLFDFEQAGLSVSLNNDFIGSFRFSDRTAQVSSWRLNLPSSSFRPGDNLLLIEANLEPTTFCVANQELWFSVRSESIMHMPLVAAPVQADLTQLSQWPVPFVPNLDKTAFVLPKNDPASWIAASKIAYDLGWKTSGVLIDPLVVFADAVPDTVKKERDLILIGQPSQMPIIQELVNMPATFDSGSDIAKEPPGGFNFRVSDNKPVGYLQVFPAPWDAQRSIMTLNGNSPQGLQLGVDALTTPDQRSLLIGNLAVLYDNQIIATEVSPAQAVSTTPQPIAVQTQQSQSQKKPTVSIFVVGTIVLIILAIFGLLVLWIGSRRKIN